MKRKPHARKNRTFFITLGAFLLLALLLALGSAAGGAQIITAERLRTAQDRADYLADCGWTVDLQSEEARVVHIPETFSDVFEHYNELQLRQGYDLKPYAGRDCTLYTYVVTNYPDDSQVVIADLYLYRDRLIGGDVHSTNLNGFMVGLK